ncbi:MAG: hypothetical protein ACYDEN_14580 [Acidimicrobiales bacterium]
MRVRKDRRGRRPAGALLMVVGLIAVGCSSGPASSGAGQSVSAGELRAYVTEVDRIRLPVNQLLTQADPILSAMRDGAISPQTASDRMGALEMRFATFTVDINALNPQNARLKRLNALYAHTFLFEDSYLSALAADLRDRNFDNLPNTQNQQRLSIIMWRTQLEILARTDHVRLPADLQQAGRGEVAPSPGVS